MTNPFSWEAFEAFPVVGILRGFSLSITSELIPILIKEQWSCVEVTLDTPNAFEQINTLSSRFGDQISIGAGTVLDVTSLDQTLEAGASFIVTPTVNVPLIEKCAASKIPVFPGAFSPTEIATAWDAGASMVKLFPANHLGPSYIKDIKAPLSHLKILATGGITPDNISDYLKVGTSGFGIGSSIFHRDKIEARDWDWVRTEIRKAKANFQ